MKLTLTLVLGLLTLTNCEEEKKDEFASRLEEISEHKEYENEAYGFTLPDSIDKSLVLAIYYDHHLQSHGVIVLKDTTKKEATNYTFLKDRTSFSDKLKQNKYNEFTSISGGIEYIVKEKSVAKIIKSSGSSASIEGIRIDN